MGEVPPSANQPVPSSWRRHAAGVAAFLALVVFFFSPLTGVMDVTLDASNYASYAYFTAQGFQYGRDIVPMYGPWGFVLPPSAYNGDLYWARWGGQLVASGGLAALVLWFFRRRVTPWRWAWLAALLLLAPYIEDLPFALTLLLGALYLLESRTTIATAAVCALLAVLSLVKGTHLLLAFAAFAVVLVFHVAQGRRLRAAGLAIAFIFAWLAAWLLAGQSLAHVPGFFRGVAALVAGYNDAMALPEPADVRGRGLLAAGLLALLVLAGAWTSRREPRVLAAALLFAGFTFAFWKHGFVRADGHIAIFHHFAAIAALTWLLVLPAPPAQLVSNLTAAALLAALAVSHPALGHAHVARVAGPWTLSHLRDSFRQLVSPRAERARLETALARRRGEVALPFLRDEIGREPVDLFGLRHGVIALNGLTYRPRPMGGGSFNVYNPYLMRLNEEFLQDPARRPAYYLLRLETIDARLATQDDGRALLELLDRYRPVRLEEDYLLMRDASPEPIAPAVALGESVVHFDQEISVPEVAPDQLLLARFTLQPTFVGRLLRFAYKLPPVELRLVLDTGTQTRRLIPAMAESPFLFSPLVDGNDDFLDLYSTAGGRTIRAFSIVAPPPPSYDAAVRVAFFAKPRPAPLLVPDAGELRAQNKAPVFSTPPKSITAADGPHELQLGRLRVQTLHAPGEIVWQLDGKEEELVFDHGILPEAVVRGQGDGVTFQVELRTRDQPPQRLFDRHVDPYRNSAERRSLTSRVVLPPHLPGTELVIRTQPGPQGNNAWDWSYVTHVLLRRHTGRAVFDRAPARLGGSAPMPAKLDEKPAVLLHVPAEVALPVAPAEQTLHLAFGFLPGAYTGDGNTPGAVFSVELERDGAASHEVFRRELRPRQREADRGEQHATLRFAAGAGGRLVVRTQPVTGADASWGWTYISRCDIE